MLFTSYEFLLFAGVLLILYYTLPKPFQWVLLLAASMMFYGAGGVGYLAYILILTGAAYLVTMLMSRISARETAYLEEHRAVITKDERKAFRAAAKKKRLRVLAAGLMLGFGILAVIKYTAFATVNLNAALTLFGIRTLTVPQLFLPLGISFYTFQTMGYIIDVYRGRAQAERNPAKLLLFVSFFPQVIQGPISRFSDLAGQLTAQHPFEPRKLAFGLQRVLWGYFKKLVVADRLLIAVRELMDNPAEYGGAYVVLLILFYSIEIYADFTGGIDITIGIAEAMDIRLTENFRRPFFSKSTKEYWRRWHITMGTWFTDYVFYPLSVSRPMQKLSKRSRELLGQSLGKRVPVYLATTATWFLTGLWHGAGWNFIVWGLLNCTVILVSQELQPMYDRFHTILPALSRSGVYSVFMMARTFWLMGTIRVLDCYRNVPLTFRMVGGIFTAGNWGEAMAGAVTSLGLGVYDYIVVLAGCVLMTTVSLLDEKRDVRERLYGRTALSSAVFSLLFVSVIIFGAYGVGYDASQFIYNQF